MNNKSALNTYKLRPKQRVNIFDRYELQEEDFANSADQEQYRNTMNGERSRPKRKRRSKR